MEVDEEAGNYSISNIDALDDLCLQHIASCTESVRVGAFARRGGGRGVVSALGRTEIQLCFLRSLHAGFATETQSFSRCTRK